jgi:hypothetical protein
MFFNAHVFTNVPKGTESPNFHPTPIFAYALLVAEQSISIILLEIKLVVVFVIFRQFNC